MKFLIVLFIALSLTSCTSVEKKEAQVAPASFKQKLLSAKNVSKRSPDKAIFLLDDLLKNNAHNSLTDDALFLKANLYEKTDQNELAIKSYKKILNSKFTSTLDGQTVLRLYAIYKSMDQEGRALYSLDYIQRNELTDKSTLEKIEQLRSPLLLKRERYVYYLESIANQIRIAKSQSYRKQLYGSALSIMDIKVIGLTNKKILDDEDLKVFHPEAALNLSSYYFEGENPQKALDVLRENDELFQSTYYKNQKSELIQRARAFESANNRTIGVLLPLSGRYKDIGQKILQGLQFSLRIWSPEDNENQIKLAVLDTEAKPELLELAFDEMIKKDRPVVFVGGLVGKTAEALVKKSEEYKVPAIVLSQKENLVERSKYSFQNSQPMADYTDYIADLAIKDLNFKTASILHSEKEFSKSYAKAFAKSFEKLGGQIINVIPYDKNEKGSITQAIKTLAQLNSINDRKEEYDEAYKAWKESSKNRRNKDKPSISDLLPPKVDSELVFIADGPKNGGLIASTLAYFDIENLPLFGTHLWNNKDLITRGQRFIEEAIFANSYFEPEVLNSECNSNYSRANSKPIDVYSYKGLEAGAILNNIYNRTSISSRSDMVYALSKIQKVENICFPKGLVRVDHNYFAPVTPLTVKSKTILVFDPENYAKVTAKKNEIEDESPAN